MQLNCLRPVEMLSRTVHFFFPKHCLQQEQDRTQISRVSSLPMLSHRCPWLPVSFLVHPLEQSRAQHSPSGAWAELPVPEAATLHLLSTPVLPPGSLTISISKPICTGKINSAIPFQFC